MRQYKRIALVSPAEFHNYITYDEVGRMLGVTRQSVRNYAYRWGLTAYKCGWNIRFKREEVIDLYFRPSKPMPRPSTSNTASPRVPSMKPVYSNQRSFYNSFNVKTIYQP